MQVFSLVAVSSQFETSRNEELTYHLIIYGCNLVPNNQRGSEGSGSFAVQVRVILESF